MSNNESLLGFCPIWSQPCMQSNCVSYESHTKQRFKNLKTNLYIPLDQLSFYSAMTQDQLNQTVERNIIITHECRNFGKIIQIENKIDHQVPLQQ
jgi:hypothetical protein